MTAEAIYSNIIIIVCIGSPHPFSIEHSNRCSNKHPEKSVGVSSISNLNKFPLIMRLFKPLFFPFTYWLLTMATGRFFHLHLKNVKVFKIFGRSCTGTLKFGFESIYLYSEVRNLLKTQERLIERDVYWKYCLVSVINRTYYQGADEWQEKEAD